MKRVFFGLLAVFFLFLSGCTTYFVKKRCQKKDWFEYGKKVAMSAARLSTDTFYNQCIKAEAEFSQADADAGWKKGRSVYCSDDQAFLNGSNGQFQDFEFCGAAQSSKMRSAHKKGVEKFCRPESGYNFGTSGGTYNNICPKSMEAPWMASFKKGRAIYLKGEIRRSLKEADEYEVEVDDLKTDRDALSRKLRLIPPSEVSTRTSQYDPVTKKYKEVQTRSEGDETRRKREQLSNEMDQLEDRIKAARANRNKAKEKARALEAELDRL